MKIKTLVFAFIYLTINLAITIITGFLSAEAQNASGIAGLSLIILLPLVIVFYLFLISALVFGIKSSVKLIMASKRWVMIVGIVLACVYAVIIGLNIYFGIGVFGLIF